MSASGHIVIAGAGIGGLTAALTLSRIGRRVTVIERAATLSEVGAGLQLSPNASRILIDHDSRAFDQDADSPERVTLW